jgi:hypothetical protein
MVIGNENYKYLEQQSFVVPIRDEELLRVFELFEPGYLNGTALDYGLDNREFECR